MRSAASTRATIDTTPIFSSAQASERVRGMTQSSGQEVSDVRVFRRAQLRGVALEHEDAILEHDELRLVALLCVGLDDVQRGAALHCLVFGDEERIAELVRHDDRADV